PQHQPAPQLTLLLLITVLAPQQVLQ
ncbi:unnamed protein product, partial [Rotaria sp. Silwood1]